MLVEVADVDLEDVLELFAALPDLDVVYVPIGMGSGVCAVVQVRDLLGLSTRVVGVVSTLAPAYALSYDAGVPVVSISLGDMAIFRIGGKERSAPTETLKLASGDVLVLGGESRLRYHGIDRTLPGTSTLVKDGGRINLTLRRVTRP